MQNSDSGLSSRAAREPAHNICCGSLP